MGYECCVCAIWKLRWYTSICLIKLVIRFIQLRSFLACGGMDNMCTVYDVNNRDPNGTAKIVRELAGYEGFLSSCRFLDDTHIITGSGDMKMYDSSIFCLIYFMLLYITLYLI